MSRFIKVFFSSVLVLVLYAVPVLADNEPIFRCGDKLYYPEDELTDKSEEGDVVELLKDISISIFKTPTVGITLTSKNDSTLTFYGMDIRGDIKFENINLYNHSSMASDYKLVIGKNVKFIYDADLYGNNILIEGGKYGTIGGYPSEENAESQCSSILINGDDVEVSSISGAYLYYEPKSIGNCDIKLENGHVGYIDTEKVIDTANVTVSGGKLDSFEFDSSKSTNLIFDGYDNIVDSISSRSIISNLTITVKSGKTIVKLLDGKCKIIVDKNSEFTVNGKTFYKGEYDYEYFPEISKFTDIGTHWARNYINLAVKSGFFNGVDETTFSPDTPITRGMAVSILYRHLKEVYNMDKENPFTDVEDGRYYTEAVLWAYNFGILPPSYQIEFKPNEPITREEFAFMIYKFIEFQEIKNSIDFIESVEDYRYDDSLIQGFEDYDDISYWAKHSVSYLVKNKIMQGKGSGYFDPSGNVTRAEMAVIITNVDFFINK